MNYNTVDSAVFVVFFGIGYTKKPSLKVYIANET